MACTNTSKMYSRRISGEGYTAVYHCATDVTKKSLTDWFSYNDTHPVAAAIAARITVLLKTWETFRTNPVRHFEEILAVGIRVECCTVTAPVIVTEHCFNTAGSQDLEG